MKFDKVFEEAVREAFATYGLVGPVMIKDIESKTGLKASKWWKKPEKIEEVIMETYGQGGRAITRNILVKLLEHMSGEIYVYDESFSQAIAKILEHLKKTKQI